MASIGRDAPARGGETGSGLMHHAGRRATPASPSGIAARRSLCRGGLLLAATASVAMASAAFAQSDKPVPAPAATATDETQTGLEDIIVTAQRRSENLQSVPVTVKAISADALRQQGITTGLDVAKLVPTVAIQQTSGTVEIYIRGIGNNVDSQGNEPSNTLYIDGVYYSRLAGSLFRFNNIEQIEVLKGPQGTLFGRNAEGGLIQIRTKDPVPGSGPSGDFSAGYGSFNTVQTSADINSGLGDKAAFDLAATYYHNTGFGHNVYNGAPANYEHSFAIRGKLVLEPAAGTRIILAADYNKSNTDVGNYAQKPGGPYAGSANTGYPDGSGLLPPIGYYDINVNEKNNYYTQEYGGHMTVEQDLGFAKLVSITAYHRNDEIYASDADFGPKQQGVYVLPSYNKQFTQELQLQSKSGSSFDWTVGAFYLNIRQGYFNSVIRGAGGTPPGSTLFFNSRAPTQSYAGYGQVTFTVVPKLKLTLGARYSDDEINGDGYVDLRFDAGFTVPAVPYASAHTSAKRLTGKGVISYQVTDDVLTYLSASRGYKSGLYNLLTFSPSYTRPEVVDAFEFGLKSQLFDRTLRFNAAAFYNKFQDPQAQSVGPNNLLILVNANRARTYGAEFDAQWVPVRNLTLLAAAAYVNARYTDFPNAPFYFSNPVSPYGSLGPFPGDASHNKIPRSPAFSGNVGFNYKIPTDSGSWQISSNYAYTGSYYWTPQNREKQNAYGLLDARVAYEFKNGFSVNVWASNITGAKYETVEQTLSGYSGDVGDAGAPRQYGVGFRYKF